MSQEIIKEQVKKYLQLETVDKHRRYIEDLEKKNDWNKLKLLLGERLSFGTAGIRGKMGPGFGQMNDLVIIQTSQGLASYLLELDSEEIQSRGVIIGFDARHNSQRFAHLTALSFLQKNIPVHLIDYICPTPLIAFGVTKYKCKAGIVITASHNPKHDNGYKVYWSNGAQILSPHDTEIQRHILMEENQKPWPLAWRHEILNLSTASSSLSSESLELLHKWLSSDSSSSSNNHRQLLYRSYKHLTASYYDYIDEMISDQRRKENQDPGSRICITYTTMHGVGHTFLTKALELSGFEDIFPVQLQKKPDPEFSTVKFPNPEEAGALDLAFETAKHANSNLILANDPDADRCAAALYDPETGRRRVLSGNEIGSLLGWWLWHCYTKLDEQIKTPQDPGTSLASTIKAKDKANKAQEEGVEAENSVSINIKTGELPNLGAEISTRRLSKKQPNDCYMISTAVSSKFLYSMAKQEGFHFVETLTGFKYMGNVAHHLITERQKEVLFAYEEAIGFMCSSRLLDKDGISAAVQLASLAAYCQREYNRTLEQQLNYLYTIYGYHFNLNSYYLCHEPELIKKIFNKLQSNYPVKFTNEFKVTRVRDLNKNYDSSTDDQKCTLPTSSSSFMVTFFINDNITLTIRTSGTEPKIKYYSEIVEKLPKISKTALNINETLNSTNQLIAKEAAQEKLRRLVNLAIEQCLEPTKYNLEPACGGTD